MGNRHLIQNQCFLLVAQEGKANILKLSSSTASKWKQIKAFVLLPSCIKKNNPKISEMFTRRRNIQVLSNRDCPALRSALELDQLEIVELILSSENIPEYSNRNVKTSTPLQISVDASNKDIVSKIFGRSAVVSEIVSHGGRIVYVTDDKNFGVMNLILSARPNIRLRESKSGTLLHLAVMRDDQILLEMLLQHGFKVNIENDEGTTPLHLASCYGNLQIVQLLLKKGAAINAKQNNGATSLHLAAEAGRLDVYKLLSSNGASISDGKFDSSVLVHAAAKNGHVEILNDLLQLGVNLNTALVEGRAPLYVALKKGQSTCVKWLLNHGADVNTLNHKSKSVLSVAIAKQWEDMVTCILSHHPDLNCESSKEALEKAILGHGVETENIVESLVQHGFTIRAEKVYKRELLHAAISKNYSNVLKMLLEMGANVNEVYKYKESPLHDAVSGSRKNIVQLLIQHGASVNLKSGWHEMTPLSVAVKRSDHEIVKLLLLHGAVVDSDAITHASMVQNVEIMETLLLNAVDISARKITPAFLNAVSNANLELVKVLLNYGAIVNENAISKAAFVFNVEIIKTLLQKAVGLSAKMIDSAFLNAVFKGNVEVVEVLLSYGAVVSGDAIYKASVRSNVEMMKTLLLNTVNLSAKMVNPAFLQAVFYGNLEVVELLLRYGAVVDAKRFDDESSAIHLAKEYDMAKLLIASNANLELEDKIGRTPLFKAAQNGHHLIVDLLLAFGAHVNVVDKFSWSALHYVFASGLRRNFEAMMDASFQYPGIMIKTNVGKLFYESYLEEDREMYREYQQNKNHFRECCKDFERYLIKVKAANPDFNDEEIDLLSWHLSDSDDFRSSCVTEIACMKRLTVGDSFVTLYDILVKDAQYVAGYVRNDTVHLTLKSIDYEEKFPIYSSIINLQIKKGIQRRVLINEGLKICRRLFCNFVSLPLELREKIVNYLTDQNLLVLKYAVTGSLQ